MDLGLAGFHVEMENLGAWLSILLLAVATAWKKAHQGRKKAQQGQMSVLDPVAALGRTVLADPVAVLGWTVVAQRPATLLLLAVGMKTTKQGPAEKKPEGLAA